MNALETDPLGALFTYLVVKVRSLLPLVPQSAGQGAVDLLHDPAVGLLFARCVTAGGSTERDLLYGAHAVLAWCRT